MDKKSILVLAAGMGSRYGGLKQLEPVGPNGETLLDYSVYDAIQSGFHHIVFIIRRDIEEAFRETVGNRYRDNLEINYAFQELDDLPPGFSASNRRKPWGTGHALYAARNSVSGCFAVINADDFYGRDAYTTLAAYFDKTASGKEMPMAMVGYPLINTLSRHGSVNRGLCTSRDGQLRGVEEITSIIEVTEGGLLGTNSFGDRIALDPASLVSMNFWGFSDRIFPRLEKHLSDFLGQAGNSETAEFYIPSFVDDVIRRENIPCKVLETCGSWFGVTYPADKSLVRDEIHELIKAGVYPSPLVV